MIDKIIGFSIRNKLIIGIFVFILIGWGIYSVKHLPVDAVPDITNNQVQIISIAPTLAANEVEQFITAPIELSVVNVPNIIELRSISRLGLSVVTVVFKDNVDIYWSRSQIHERLNDAASLIPEGLAKTDMAPISTGLSEIYQYILNVKDGYKDKFSPTELRSIQDWIVRRELLGTPGVADVNSYGGFIKQYEVAVNPDKLRSMNITLTDIFSALEKNNQNTGSAYIDKKPNAYFIRGLGLVNNLDDIENIVVKNTKNGIPVLIRDISKVQFGTAPRYGAFVVDTSGEAVGGVVMMLKGKNASEVIDDVKERVETIQKSLPEGVEMIPYLDRTDLVERALGTVSRNLIEGGLIVIFILVILLGNLRAGFVVASVIPLAMLFAISMMNLFGVSGNLMSLGAIDFGLIVDGAVIIVENIAHHINRSKSVVLSNGKLSSEQMDAEVHGSSKRMMSSAIFGQIIILIVYIPILALIGIEGKMFRPMAQTVSFAILGAIILSLTYVPVASALFLSRKPRTKATISDRIMNKIHKVYDPLLNLALRRKISVIVISTILFLFSLLVYNKLGGEFIPTLEEGDLAAGVMTLQGGSLTNTIESVTKANKILMDKFPEVKHAICKIGAGEIPTDPTPMETGDYIIVMKPKNEWKSASSRDEMMDKMQKELSALKGVVFTLQQPIQMRFNELMTGSKQDVAIKIFGDNLDILTQKSNEVEKIINKVEGVEDINLEKVTGSGQIQVRYNREKIAEYGLNISDINNLLKTAFAGNAAGVVFDEEKRFDLVVRFDKEFRQDIQYIRELYVPLPNGNQIPMAQLASIEYKNGTAQVSRENTKRRITIGFNVRNRDVQSVIKEVRTIIDKKMSLPPGYYVTYGGQFQNLVEANKRLAVAVPIALLLIFLLLYFTFSSITQTLLIFTAVPLSAIGGIMALSIRGMNFSISAGVGFIALFGVAVLNGIVMIAEFNRLEKEEGMTDIYERVKLGLKSRLRPVIMTASVASLGFLPMALSVSAGAEVQKPLATVVIGGLLSSTMLTLIVLPVLYILFSGRKKIGKTIISKTLIMLLALIAFTTTQVFSQNPVPKTYSLEQAVERVIKNNPAIQNAILERDYQKKLKMSSLDIGKTSVDLSYGQMNSLTNDNNLTLSQSFSFPTLYANQYKLAKANIKNADNELTIATNQQVYEVKKTYFNLAYYNSKLALLKSLDSLYSNFIKSAELKVKTGESPPMELNSAQVQAMEISIQLNETESDLAVWTNKLQILLNENENIVIADQTIQKLNFVDRFDSSITANNPDLEILKQQMEMSRIQHKIEKSKLLPDFNIGYFSQSIIGNQDVNGAPVYYDANQRFTGIQAGISIPLWFMPQRSNIRAAAVREKQALNSFESYMFSLNKQFQSAYQEYLKYKKSLGYYETTALPLADKIMKHSTKSYQAGNIDYVEYVQNLDKAISIRSNYLNTLNSYDQSVIELEYLIEKR